MVQDLPSAQPRFDAELGDAVEVAFLHGPRRVVRWSKGTVSRIDPTRVQVHFPCDGSLYMVSRLGDYSMVIRKSRASTAATLGLARSGIAKRAVSARRPTGVSAAPRRSPRGSGLSGFRV